jgi:hypothetical protein
MTQTSKLKKNTVSRLIACLASMIHSLITELFWLICVTARHEMKTSITRQVSYDKLFGYEMDNQLWCREWAESSIRHQNNLGLHAAFPSSQPTSFLQVVRRQEREAIAQFHPIPKFRIFQSPRLQNSQLLSLRPSDASTPCFIRKLSRLLYQNEKQQGMLHIRLPKRPFYILVLVAHTLQLAIRFHKAVDLPVTSWTVHNSSTDSRYRNLLITKRQWDHPALCTMTQATHPASSVAQKQHNCGDDQLIYNAYKTSMCLGATITCIISNSIKIITVPSPCYYYKLHENWQVGLRGWDGLRWHNVRHQIPWHSTGGRGGPAITYIS